MIGLHSSGWESGCVGVLEVVGVNGHVFRVVNNCGWNHMQHFFRWLLRERIWKKFRPDLFNIFMGLCYCANFQVFNCYSHSTSFGGSLTVSPTLVWRSHEQLVTSDSIAFGVIVRRQMLLAFIDLLIYRAKTFRGGECGEVFILRSEIWNFMGRSWC